MALAQPPRAPILRMPDLQPGVVIAGKYRIEKELGTVELPVRLHPDVVATLTVDVVAQ